jgi:hypothetical protein
MDRLLQRERYTLERKNKEAKPQDDRRYMIIYRIICECVHKTHTYSRTWYKRQQWDGFVTRYCLSGVVGCKNLSDPVLSVCYACAPYMCIICEMG